MKASVKADPARGQRLKLLRNAAGLSMSGAARKLGVDKGSVARWEKGIVFPREHLRQLCELYDSDPEYVTFGVQLEHDSEPHPAYHEFVAWLQSRPERKLAEPWILEALRTLRMRLPPSVEPNLEVYQRLFMAMLAMDRK